jgi:hypothetical protein
LWKGGGVVSEGGVVYEGAEEGVSIIARVGLELRLVLKVGDRFGGRETVIRA